MKFKRKEAHDQRLYDEKVVLAAAKTKSVNILSSFIDRLWTLFLVRFAPFVFMDVLQSLP